MKNLKALLIVFVAFLIFSACSTSKLVVAQHVNLQDYKYVVFGKESTGDRDLDDIVMEIQNEISNSLEVVSSEKAQRLIRENHRVLTPNINVKTEKWDGGHTYITINFYDYETDQSVAVLKSSGIGMTISQDQSIAINAMKKKLKNTFK